MLFASCLEQAGLRPVLLIVSEKMAALEVADG